MQRILPNFVFYVVVLLYLGLVSCGSGLGRRLGETVEDQFIAAINRAIPGAKFIPRRLSEGDENCHENTNDAEVSLDDFLNKYPPSHLHQKCELGWTFAIIGTFNYPPDNSLTCQNIKWTEVRDAVRDHMKDVVAIRLVAVHWKSRGGAKVDCRVGALYAGPSDYGKCHPGDNFFKGDVLLKEIEGYEPLPDDSSSETQTFCNRTEVNLLNKTVNNLAIFFGNLVKSLEVEFRLELIKVGNGAQVQPFDYKFETDVGDCQMNEPWANDSTDWEKVNPATKGCSVTRKITHPLDGNFDEAAPSVGTYYSTQIPAKSAPSQPTLRLLDIVIRNSTLSTCAPKGSSIGVYVVKVRADLSYGAAINGQTQLTAKSAESNATTVVITMGDAAFLKSAANPLVVVRFPKNCKVERHSTKDGVVESRFVAIFGSLEGDKNSQTDLPSKDSDGIGGGASSPNFLRASPVLLLVLLFWAIAN